MRGRPVKPNVIKEIHGTLRKSRLPKNEIQPSIEVNLTAPDDLNEWGAKYWMDITGQYAPLGLITKVDVEALHSVCMWYGTMREAQDLIAAKGLEVEVVKTTPKGESYTVTETNPMLNVADKAFKNYIAMCREFGLTPASRAKLSAPDTQSNDKFAEFEN